MFVMHCSQFFEFATESQLKQLADKLNGHIKALSGQMYGCRVVQKVSLMFMICFCYSVMQNLFVRFFFKYPKNSTHKKKFFLQIFCECPKSKCIKVSLLCNI